jgi:hypothetical protein
MELLAKTARAIDLDDPRIDYDIFIKILRAICAACGGSLDFLHSVVWPWVCERQTVARGQGPRTEERGIEWIETRWRSFTDSQLGAEYVYGWAAMFGETEAIVKTNDEAAQEIFKKAPMQPTPEGDADDGAPGSAQAAVSGSVGGGRTPFPYTDLALADRFASEHPNWKFTSDEGWMRLQNGVFMPDQTILYPIGQMSSAVGDPYRSQGARTARLDVMLKGVRKHRQ